ncbi:hypothetical protein [Burkholderia pseudomallei]|uniref:hypothetical protein n=1 Tax=Burkholderia pseudomallei TaxID=28450 RepID=UPI0005106B6F|nr:hypothetical protein [Burkholderia pseudomallei]KGW45398.1 hypothetical protein Y049_4107 [Burkholderia pseudomallei MSHR684]AIV45891.1 hypothetical protein X988_4360 [Burkholderia pseudomallei TSV 48]KGC23892.1 hypothetical protein DO64_2195 [Burkholderia pseudomallei]KGW01816.1 hypothetical protein X882_1544 [Burkholderia pseudomallei MSHR4303]KGW18318.1 hypothetical protein X899_5919 [Burkholderia pseudomallei TSV 25]
MITVITSFQLPAPLAREEARSLFLRAAPKHQGVVGLCANTMSCRKAEGQVYLWNARAQAETMYTDAWKASAYETFGAFPSITYFESPAVVDNATNAIFSDE